MSESWLLQLDADSSEQNEPPAKNSPPKQVQKALSPPNEAWEAWMEWNPLTEEVIDQRLFPSDTDCAGSHEQNKLDQQSQNPVSATVTSTKKRKAIEDIGNKTSELQEHSISLHARSHRLVEKRYRSNLNEKFAEIRQRLPSLQDSYSSTAKDQDSVIAPKHNKATVLAKAIEYIDLLEKQNASLEDANKCLRSRARRMAKRTRVDETNFEEKIHQSCGNTLDEPNASSQVSTATVSEPCGMIPLPDDIKQLRNSVPPQSHYADQAPFQDDDEGSGSGNFSVRGSLVGKLLIGSLAGLMVIDSFVGNRKEPSSDRGLFALYVPDLLPVLQSIWVTVQAPLVNVPHDSVLVPLTRTFLIFAMLGITLFLYLFNSKPELGKHDAVFSPNGYRLSRSPIEMRQNAWLTALQTVWVPRHTMLPELLALLIETNAYITRRILGWHCYSWLTGRNEEKELGRVRAWEIAIDSQLAGGDAEISKSRLVLTLWASGTLPNTPARLMLKALHIRILFWRASRYLWICELFNFAARHLARKQWRLGEDLVNNPTIAKDPSGSDPLPDHLVALLQQPIDGIMTESAIQHAYNLAWYGERETNIYTEDTIMLGSLDSLAVCSSNFNLQQAFYAFIEDRGTPDFYQSQIELALRVAPPGSVSSMRALAAAAILCETDRQVDITSLFAAVRPSDRCSSDASQPAASYLANAACEHISIVKDCASAMQALTKSENQSESLCEALLVSDRILSKAKSLDLLVFVATYQLLLMISKHANLVGQIALRFNEHLLDAVTQLDQTNTHTMAKNAQLQRTYKRALNQILIRGRLERRVSNISIDTGYGSMTDHNPNS